MRRIETSKARPNYCRDRAQPQTNARVAGVEGAVRVHSVEMSGSGATSLSVNHSLALVSDQVRDYFYFLASQ